MTQFEVYRGGPEFDASQVEQMKSLTDNFLSMREKIGVGENIGFGCLVDAHKFADTCSGAVFPYDFDETLGQMVYGHPRLLFGVITQYTPTPITQVEHAIFVTPKITDQDKIMDFPWYPARGGIVTIYDASQGKVPMSKEVIVGIIAHELAEVRVRTVGIPEDLQATLHEKAKYKDDSYPHEIHDRNKESDYDIVAAKLGYKKEILAMLENGLAHFNLLKQIYASAPYFCQQVDVAISEMEFRREQVQKFS